jgi:hypothetical protein
MRNSGTSRPAAALNFVLLMSAPSEALLERQVARAGATTTTSTRKTANARISTIEELLNCTLLHYSIERPTTSLFFK